MAKQPNIVLMGVDSLLATHMSCYGYNIVKQHHTLISLRKEGLFLRKLIVPTSQQRVLTHLC